MRSDKHQSTDHELEQALNHIRAKYRQLGNEEPPELLDQAVMNLAQREAEAQHASRRRRMQWIGALSSMALLVVTLNLVIDQQTGPAAPMETETDFRLKKEREEAPGAVSEDLSDQAIGELREDSSAEAMRQAIPQAPRASEKASAGLELMADSPEESDRPDYKSDPQAWWLRIMELRDQGLDAEAEAELEEFRAAYPEFPVPASPQ